ncbi:histidine kinase dimerization/phospho-acceptor domain-containing protein [Methanolobus sp. ZRKC3]|uniref:histidine kinase dimerization/phospho-acceptor domain-containing protein n=1 Tax=Methanolobus sp. ZRKC3 TaxID=3125786 RepID=UPI00324ADEB5
MNISSRVKRFFDDFEKGIFDGRKEIFEIEQYHRDGHAVWPEAVANAVFDESGKFKFFLGVTREITERKEAEESIRQYADELSKANESLEILDKMKDEFISNLSHELKTPLISIKGYSELVHDEVLGTLNDAQKMP